VIRRNVLHCLTQWMWLSDSFVYGPISVSRHRPVVFSRMEVINAHVYPPPADLFSLSGAAEQQGGGEVPAEGPPTATAVARFLGPIRADVVHLHHGYNLPDASAIASLLRVPLVVSFWGYDVTGLPAREPERLSVYLSVPDIILVPSRFLAHTVAALGVNASRIRVLPGSVDTRRFRPTPLPTEPRVAFVGRFVPKKGLDTLMRAWPVVRRAVPGAELTLLGYGNEPPPADPAMGIRVLAPDPADPRGQVYDLIRWCRVYVAPSKTGPDGDAESQHIGNLEAQAGGRVVLTTDHGPIPEFVQHLASGFVVPQDDPEALASAAIALLRDYDLCSAISERAHVAAQRFDVSVAGAALDALYDDLASGAGPAAERPRGGGQ
jgi:colanic acid/amylovoran biosynthesis glycosyltransferase